MANFDKSFSIARSSMLLLYPFYGYLALSTVWRTSETIKTAEIDPHSYDTVNVNPEWFCRLGIKERRAVIAHITSHLAWEHLYRRGGRRKDVWNAACDLVVDEMLHSVNLQTPDAAMPPPDVEVEGKSVDSVYHQLLQRKNDDKKQQKGGSCGNGTIGMDLPQENSDPQPQKQKNDGNNNTNSGTPNADGDGDNSDPNDPNQQQDGDGAGGQGNVPPRRIPWPEKIKEAANYAQNADGQGSVPSGLDRQLLDMQKPYVSWWHFIMQSVTTQDFKLSYARPSRSHMWRDIYIPTRRPRHPTIAIAVDTSGSITINMLSEFIAEVRTLLEQMHVGVRLIACDAKVHLDIVLEPGDPIPLDIGGGGGTRFGPVFELLAKDASPPPVLVYYTDGWGSFPDEHWPWRTLWVVTPDHAEPPFGERALFEPMNWRNREDL